MSPEKEGERTTGTITIFLPQGFRRLEDYPDWRRNRRLGEGARTLRERWQALPHNEKYRAVLAFAEEQGALTVQPDLEMAAYDHRQWTLAQLIMAAEQADIPPEEIRLYREQHQRLVLANEIVGLRGQMAALENALEAKRQELKATLASK